MTMRKGEEEKEEKERLVMAITKVVEYLEPLMSKELLCKFPNNLVFDFDYTQSSIWSPLVTKKALIRDGVYGFGQENKLKKVTSNIRKKINTTSFNINLNLLKMKHKIEINLNLQLL